MKNSASSVARFLITAVIVAFTVAPVIVSYTSA